MAQDKGVQQYWDALRPQGERAFRAWGGEQRMALMVLWGGGEDPVEIITQVGKWLEHMGVDDVEEIVYAWDMLMDPRVDDLARKQAVKIFLDSLGSFPARTHLLSSLVRGLPGPSRAQRAEDSWPHIRQWLTDRQDHASTQWLVEAMLDHAMRFACVHEDGQGLLRYLLSDEAFDQRLLGRAVDLWLDHGVWDPAAEHADKAMALMIEVHGQVVPANQRGVDLLVKVAEALNSPDNPPAERALDLLLTAGAPFEQFPKDQFPGAWERIQAHPRVKSARLLDLVCKPDEATRKPRF